MRPGPARLLAILASLPLALTAAGTLAWLAGLRFLPAAWLADLAAGAAIPLGIGLGAATLATWLLWAAGNGRPPHREDLLHPAMVGLFAGGLAAAFAPHALAGGLGGLVALATRGPQAGLSVEVVERHVATAPRSGCHLSVTFRGPEHGGRDGFQVCMRGADPDLFRPGATITLTGHPAPTGFLIRRP